MKRKFTAIWLTIVLLSFLPQVSQAGQALVFLPGGGTLTKPVQSLKERRMRQIVPQTRDFSCGAASLATILHYYYGWPYTELATIQGMMESGDLESIRKKGFSMLDMKRYVKSLGFQAEGYSFDKVDPLKKLKIPAIALIDTKSYKHFVVVRRVGEDYVYLADPSYGNRRMRLQEFVKAWNDNVLLLMVGPKVGSPPGLLPLAEELILPKHQTLRIMEAKPWQPVPMDPTTSLLLYTPIRHGSFLPVLPPLFDQ